MAGNLSLPPVGHFVIAEGGNLDQLWRKWSKSFTYFLVASKIVDKDQKLATLLHLAGPAVQEIFETFEEDDTKTYDAAVLALEAYFHPRKNLRFERHIFRQQCQEDKESMDSYVTRLKNFAKTCEFATLEEDLIVDQVLEKGRDKGLRRRLLRETTVTLKSLLTMARSAEASEQHATAMERDSVEKPKESTVSSINENKHFKSRGNRRGRGTFRKFNSKPHNVDDRRENKTQAAKMCFRCGHNDHLASECTIAKNKECGFCHKLGHFSKVCRAKNADRGRGNKDRVRYVGVNEYEREHDGSDSDYSWCVSAGKSTSDIVVRIENQKVNVLIDSGSTVNLVDQGTWNTLKSKGIKLTPTNTRLFAYGVNEPLVVSGEFHAEVGTVKKSVNARFLVVPSGKLPLLGRATSKQLGILKLEDEIVNAVDDSTLFDETVGKLRDDLSSRIKKYKEVFNGIGRLKDYELELHVDPLVRPVAQMVRRIPFHIRKQVDMEIDNLLKADIIEPVTGATEWVSPMVPVRKPDGTIRICLDMRAVNEAVKRNRHPLPTMDEVLDEIDGAEMITKLDCRWGYLQIPLQENSRKYTVFVTHRGLFQYKRLFFGIASAPEEYQRIVQNILADCEGTRNSLDDIVVHGRTTKEHDKRLEKVLETLMRNGLTLNLKKCAFGVTRLTFLGHIISKKGISVAEQKVEAVRNATAPKNETEIRSFLGLVNYCARYIPNFATIAEPLRVMARKDVVFSWKKPQNDAFNKLKESLCSSGTLAFFKKNVETELIVDASPVGLGAVLVQRQVDGLNQPIAYASRTLSDVERRYSTTEKEALAVVWGCERFRLYLIGMPFKLITDHKALEIIYSVKSKPSARIERWVLRLQPYEFTIKHRPGSSNIADALSRLLPVGEGKTVIGKTEKYVHFILENAIPKAMTLKHVEVASRADGQICTIATSLRDATKFTQELQKFEPIRNELMMAGDVLLRGTRIVMPTALRKKVIELAHRGHQGVVRTKQRLREKVWWPGLDHDVEHAVRQCRACQFNSSATEKPEPIKSTILPKGPWRDLALDICGPFNDGHSIIVLVDYYSRWPEARILKSTKAEKIISWLRGTFECWGLPETLTSDNGPQFVSEQFRDFMDECGTQHRRVTPYWPQANGQVERLNKSFVKAFRSAKIEGEDWKKTLGTFLEAYRSTPHRTTGVSPYELMTTRKMRNKIPQIMKEQRGKLHRIVKNKDAEEKAKSKQFADHSRKSKESEIRVGDRVLVAKSRFHKLDLAYEHDLMTVSRKDGNCVSLKTSDGRIIKRNVTKIRRYIPLDEDIGIRGEDNIQIEAGPEGPRADTHLQPGSPPREALPRGRPLNRPAPGPLRRSKRNRRPPDYLKMYVR